MLTLCFLLINATHLFAQDSLPASPPFVLKFNLAPPVYKCFSFQLEKAIRPRESIAIGFMYMAPRPYVDNAWIGFGQQGVALDADGNYSGFHITPEYRAYFNPKKRILSGLYIAAYSRFMSYRLFSNITYDGAENYVEKVYYQGISIGAMLGKQFRIGNQWIIDWWIAGAHTGLLVDSRVDVEGDFILTTPIEMNEIYNRDHPPFGKLDRQEFSNGVFSARWKGQWFGARFGLCVGYVF